MGDDFDVAVIGGGPAGTATAAGLARRGRHVVVVDAGRGARGACEDLPPAGRPLLARLGLDPARPGSPHVQCFGHRGVWGSPDLVDSDFLLSPHGFGWRLDRPAFDAELCELARRAGATSMPEARLREMVATGGGWRLIVSRRGGGAATLTARFVVDASGLARVVARHRGRTVRWHDRLAARAARFTASAADEDRRSLVEAAADGWWYSAPVPGGGRLVLLFGDVDDPWFAGSRTTARFLDRMAETSHVRRVTLGAGARLAAPLTARAAATTCLDRPLGRRWLAVGDAAHSLDPLSSQGLLHALTSAERAVEAIDAMLDGAGADAAGAYGEHLARFHRRYREEHREIYGRERRWRQRPFWRRRDGRGATTPTSGAAAE